VKDLVRRVPWTEMVIHVGKNWCKVLPPAKE